MGKIIFILGGARSGKSNYAVKVARKNKGQVDFFATCQTGDKEIKKMFYIKTTDHQTKKFLMII